MLVDNFTKFVKLYPVGATGADALLRCTGQFVNAYGLPRRFITDRGTCYTSKVFEKFCLEQGIQLVLTSSRNPRANGQVERVHSVVMAAIITRNDAPEDWDRGLPEVERCLNNSESKVTRKTPFELLHGYRARFRLGALREITTSSDNWIMPQELWKEARDQL